MNKWIIQLPPHAGITYDEYHYAFYLSRNFFPLQLLCGLFHTFIQGVNPSRNWLRFEFRLQFQFGVESTHVSNFSHSSHMWEILENESRLWQSHITSAKRTLARRMICFWYVVNEDISRPLCQPRISPLRRCVAPYRLWSSLQISSLLHHLRSLNP